MARFVNTFALSTERISSAEIGPLGMVAHKLNEAGKFVGRVQQGNIEVARFELFVEKGNAHGQADVDLSKLVVRPGDAPRRSARFKVSQEGFVIFFVSEGAGGYSVTLEAPKQSKKSTKTAIIFDSQALTKDDLFVVTLVRPGIWTAHDRPSSGVSEITVTYPEIKTTAYRPSEQGSVVEVTEKGMNPKALKIGPGEGVVFQIAAKTASITVELTKPDDGKPKKGTTESKPKGKRRVRWTNPRSPKP